MSSAHIDAFRSLSTITLGAMGFLLSQGISKCAEYVFVRSFGEFDSVLKHVAYVCAIATVAVCAAILISNDDDEAR